MWPRCMLLIRNPQNFIQFLWDFVNIWVGHYTVLQNSQFAAIKDRSEHFLLFWRFLSSKSTNYKSYELWKSKKPPNCQYAGFLVVFWWFLCVFLFLAVFQYFDHFNPPNPLIRKIIVYGNLKNYQTTNMRFFGNFCVVLVSF